MAAQRAGLLFWAAVAAVLVCALVAGWYVFGKASRSVPAEPVQTSLSPDGRWEVRTWFVGDERLGHPEGVLRVDVMELTALRGALRTIYVDPVPDRQAARRPVLWGDADHVRVPLAQGGQVVLDVARAPSQPTPGEFTSMMKATAIASATLFAVLVAGVFAVLLVNSWLTRRREARWEDWPVDWAHGRRRATRG